MQKDVKDRDYQTEDGQTTKYQVETYNQEGQDPIVVVRNDPNNEGQPFGQDTDKRNEVTLDEADRVDRDFETFPSNQEMYQERPDGDFDKVSFEAKENDQGNLVWQEEREQVNLQEVEKRLDEYEKTVDLSQENMPSDYRDLDKSELDQYQNQVDQHQEQLYEQGELTSGVQDMETETANQTQQQQDEVSRQERQKTQEISR